MTYDGSLTISNSNSIRIPNVKSLVPTGSAFGSSNNGRSNFWEDDDFYYNSNAGQTYRADKSNPASFYPVDGQVNQFFASSYVSPTLIGDYFYVFGTNLAGFDQPNSKAIYRAHKSTPHFFVDTGAQIAEMSYAGIFYNDGTNLWIFGGKSDSFTGTADTIQTATVANPTVWTIAGTLPSHRDRAAFAVVGSTLYIYGGDNVTGPRHNTILTASAANPAAWTTSGTLLPTAMAGGTVYQNSTHIYVLGGIEEAGATENSIFRATVANPLSLTNVGSLAASSSDRGQVFTSNGQLYFLYSSGVQKAAESSPLTWTDSALSLAANAFQPHVGVHNGNVYVFGGIGSSVATTTIQVAPTSNPDSFVISSNSLPAAVAGGTLIKTSSHFYIIGGNGATGAYYRASLTDPTVWTTVSTNGPPFTQGKAFIHNDTVYYIGGESTPGSTTTRLYRAAIVNGQIADSSWQYGPQSGISLLAPASISRFSLAVAGNYVYVIGGVIGSTMTNKVWRMNLSDIVSGWVEVTSLSVGTSCPILAVINNYLYIIGGGTNAACTTRTRQTSFASMSDLANGSANFTTEANFVQNAWAGCTAVCVNDTLWLYGTNTGSSAIGTKAILRSGEFTKHSLAMPRIPENRRGYATVDDEGTLGSYSSFQKLGMLPWLVQ